MLAFIERTKREISVTEINASKIKLKIFKQLKTVTLIVAILLKIQEILAVLSFLFRPIYESYFITFNYVEANSFN